MVRRHIRRKYVGLDDRKNYFIENPLERFHPMKNYCTEYMFAAHENVKLVFSDDDSSFKCDCGDEKVTRAALMNPDDPTSRCVFKFKFFMWCLKKPL